MGNLTDPLVSIIVNCFNGEKYLKEALQSVLKQTYKNWELIFWDNQSTDNSKKIFYEFDEKRFKYFSSEKHTTLYEARNNAINKSKGEIIAFLDMETPMVLRYSSLKLLSTKRFTRLVLPTPKSPTITTLYASISISFLRTYNYTTCFLWLFFRVNTRRWSIFLCYNKFIGYFSLKL